MSTSRVHPAATMPVKTTRRRIKKAVDEVAHTFDADYICLVLDDLMQQIASAQYDHHSIVSPQNEGWQRALQIIRVWKARGSPKGAE